MCNHTTSRHGRWPKYERYHNKFHNTCTNWNRFSNNVHACASLLFFITDQCHVSCWFHYLTWYSKCALGCVQFLSLDLMTVTDRTVPRPADRWSLSNFDRGHLWTVVMQFVTKQLHVKIHLYQWQFLFQDLSLFMTGSLPPNSLVGPLETN